MKKKILVFQHVKREHASTIAEYARERGHTLDVVPLYDSYVMPNVSDYDGLVVLGGSMGVYEEYPGKEDELTAIRENIGKVPMLGICLGAQLLAHALGASVYPHVRGGKRIKEIGYYDVVHTPEGARCKLFKGLPSTMRVLQWHGDTFDVPEGSSKIAMSTLCENQAFCKKNVHGIQFHVEATPELVSELLEADRTWASTDFDLDAPRILEDARGSALLMREQCFKLMDNFLS